MGFMVSTERKEYKIISADIHPAICIGYVDLGEQYNSYYKNTQNKLLLMFEVTDETIERDGEEKRMTISKEYTRSLNERSNLRKELESWRGQTFTDAELQGFDMDNLVGKRCRIQVVHNENGYAKINNLLSAAKGHRDTLENEPIRFTMNENIDRIEEELDKLPLWIQRKVTASNTYKELYNAFGKHANDFDEIKDDDDDEGLPF